MHCFLWAHIMVCNPNLLHCPCSYDTGAAEVGTGIIGIFNVSQRQLSEMIPLSKFPGVIPGQSYIVRAHKSGNVSRIMKVDDPDPLLFVSLELRGYDIFSAYPLATFQGAKHFQGLYLANLGLLGKMSGAAAVVDNEMTELDNGRLLIQTNLKALGVLGTCHPNLAYRALLIRIGIYISDLTERSVVDTLLVTILGLVVPVHTVSISKVAACVLEIDVERAWTELNLESRWSNEVEVKIYISHVHQ